MHPIRCIQDFIRYREWERHIGSPVYAFFLYTNVDKNIVKYVREFFNDIDDLTGPNLRLFLFEKPTEEWEKEANKREYWQDYKRITSCKDRVLFPYKLSEAYKIAEHFHISPQNFPCIIFFQDIDNKHILIYRINNTSNEESIAKELRSLFSKTYVIGNYNNDKEKNEIIWHNLQKFINSTNWQRGINQIINNPNTKTLREILLDLYRTFYG